MDDVQETVDTLSGAPTIASLWSEMAGRAMTDSTLAWPADVFALVGTVLSRTHAYRFAVSPPAGRHWPPRGSTDWNGAICGAAEQWAAWAEALEGPRPSLVADAW